MRARGLAMICANPDIVVERGDTLVYCAGAIADLYAAAGGEVQSMPASPTGRSTSRRSRPRRRRADGTIDHARVLAIGDSVRTDLKGAAAFGIDCLFVTAGIHAEELGGRDNPEPGGARRYFRGGRALSEGGDATAGVVAAARGLESATPPPAGSARRRTPAAILCWSVCALNGLTM